MVRVLHSWFAFTFIITLFAAKIIELCLTLIMCRWRKQQLKRWWLPQLEPRLVQREVKAHCSRRMLATLESEETFNQREISLASSGGQSIFASSVKREFFFRDSRCLPLSTNSQRLSTETKVTFNFPLFVSTILINIICLASQLLKLLAKYKPETKQEKKTRL